MKSLCISTGLFLLFLVPVVRAQVCPGTASLVNLVGPVTRAPFTADYVHIAEPVNRDGSHGHQEAHGKLYRDSEGRTRCEIKNRTGKAKYVIISDPVANISIRMNFEQQTAMVTHFLPSSSPFAPSTPRQGTETKSPVSAQRQEDHREEDLGAKDIEGFMATGRRYINTTETGQTSTTEDWYSTDLHFKLLSTMNSPIIFHYKDQLYNIRTGNPDPSAFKVPEGFAVKDLYCRGNVCGFDSE